MKASGFGPRREPTGTRGEGTEGKGTRPTAELVVYTPAGAVITRWPLADQDVIIGRSPECDIRLPSLHVSRRHAQIVSTATGHRILDLGSTNGVLKGGIRGASWDLRFGDEVELGGYRAVYVVAGEDPDRTIPDPGAAAAADRLRVDDDRREVWLGERRLDHPLSRLEFKLLSFLYARAGRVCSREEIGNAVWGPGGFVDMMVHQLVHRVREKLGDHPEHPRYLINVPGQGYRLDL